TVTLSTNGSQTPVYKVIYTHTEGANAGSSAEFKVYDNLGVEISEVEYAAIRKIAGSVEASTPVKTAAYYTFYGSIADNRSEWTSEQIRALASKGFSAKPDQVTIKKGDRMVVVAMPVSLYNGDMLSAVNNNTNLPDDFSKVGTFEVSCVGEHKTNYNVYAWIAPQGAGSDCKFTLSY
ncbi:MAG: hypothetical protein RSD85_01700, partial [Erysipelotrichaceae bacterium]